MFLGPFESSKLFCRLKSEKCLIRVMRGGPKRDREAFDGVDFGALEALQHVDLHTHSVRKFVSQCH